MTDERTAFNDVFQGGGEMGALMRAYDWTSTPLGRPEDWPRSLQSIVRMMLTSRYQMWMAWGEALTFFCNDAYSPTLGIKHPLALGKPAKAVWAEIWADISPLIDRVLATGEANYSEAMLLFLQRSGFPEETYHTFSYSPLFDDEGEIAGMFCVVVEETQRVISERRLTTLRQLASGVAVIRREDELLSAIKSELGRNLADLPFTLTYLMDKDGQSASLAATTGVDLNHPMAPPALRPGSDLWPLQAALEQGQPTLVSGLGERFTQLPKGAWDTPPASAMLVPIAEQGHERAAGFLIVGLNPYRPLDLAYADFLQLLAGQIAAALASTRAYEAERRRAEALAEIDRAKTAFFSNVSHEFRTPLTLMLGPLEDVLAEGAPPDIETRVSLAHRNGLRLLRLVNSLLDFSRIEAGRAKAEFRRTDLAAFSAEIASGFRSAIERAGLTLVIDAPPLPRPVYVDQDLWEKVLLNLLSNAFKFTFKGQIKVEVAASADEASVEIRVSDTGIGIAEGNLPRLFERFHRIEGARGRNFEGSGIGLALVQELVGLHGGTISVESVLGEGTQFIIRLPYGDAPRGPDPLGGGEAASPSAYAEAVVEDALRWLPDGEGRGADLIPGAAEDRAAGQKGRVLLADDNSDMLHYVRRLLQTEGYQVQAVADGEAALAAARAALPDLILSDVMMPGMGGFGLLRAIRSEPALAGVPFVLLSARAGEEAKVEGLEAGADDYLIKPFAARELLARVAVNIQMARLRRDAAHRVLQSEQRVQITQERLELALASGRIAVFQFDPLGDDARVLGPLVSLFGVSEQTGAGGLPLSSFIDGIHPEDRARVKTLIQASIDTAQPYEAEFRVTGGDRPRRVIARGQLQTGVDGRKRLVGAVIDISEEKEAEDALREQTRALQTLNAAGSAVASELELSNVVQTVTDAGVVLTKAEYGAFFYTVRDEGEERYMLYALSGAEKAAFEPFEMPRKTEIFAPTYSGEAIVRADDIFEHPSFGRNQPYAGMPEGHLDIRSYLAVPVKSRSGEVLGGLLFGHSKPGVFTPQSESALSGLAAQAAVAIDNARLFEAAQREIAQRRAAEAELQALNSGLEERIALELDQRMKAEEALRQAQKMEAVGQLTGGVAHDFNNLLTVIIGGLDTVRRNAPDGNARLMRALDMAAQGAHRAATLTARLLAFSRRQPLEPKPLDLNLVVRDSTELLHRTLGETIELEGVLAPRLWPVEVDQNQLESAILNLAVNARDAMPDGGKLTIETANTLLDEAYSAMDREVAPGQYAMISVSDSGEGMTAAVLERVFEPFYTTKEVGRGTGLGLSMVYGFVKQSGGHVTIYSEPGEGTTVKLYFPRFRGSLGPERPLGCAGAPESMAEETVLLVEDNEDVRSYSASILTELGYHVLEASDAEEGLAIARKPGRIDLLFTDVVLPGRSGRVLADEVRAFRPKIKVLFTTGYSRNAIVHQGRLDPGVNLITKPFSFDQLARRLRDVLDG